MQTVNQVSAARKSALRKAKTATLNIGDLLELLEEGNPVADTMPDLRVQLDELTQRVHEFDAFNNVLHTGS